ncbi:MAG: acyltransferase [Methanomicrobiales archaeon]|nr:acyltransferase [Methanomicrobiales archaeon]
MEGSREGLLSRCILPDLTQIQERMIVADADIIVGDRCRIGYGLHGENIAICDFCEIEGIVRAEGDLRIDNFSEVRGDVIVEGDAFLGEGVKIKGKLTVLGDMDIGDNVQIERGFEAKGWIVIRNPIPVIVYILLYLFTLLHMEREEEVERLLKELSGEEGQNIPLVLPPKTLLADDGIVTQQSFTAGSSCRLHGMIKAREIEIGEKTVHFGSLNSDGVVRIGPDVVVHGEIVSEGSVEIGAGAHIMGNIRAAVLELHEGARVDGLIMAREGLRIRREDEGRGNP